MDEELYLPDSEFDPFTNLIFKWQMYGSLTQDSYPEYHIASMMVLISHLIKAEMRPQFGAIKNNMWGIILGSSTVSGKSTACKAVMEKLVSEKEITPSVCTLTTKITPEALTCAFAEPGCSRRLHYVDEAAGLLILLKRDFALELNQDLIKAYDGTTLSKMAVSKNGGKPVIATNPTYSALWNTTPESFTSHAEREQFLNGFLLRPFFIMPQRRKLIREDESESEKAKEMKSEILTRLTSLLSLIKNRTVIFNESKIIARWKHILRQEYSTNKHADIENSAIGRSFELARKIAMNFTLASDDFYQYLVDKKEQTGDLSDIFFYYDIPEDIACTACDWAEQYFYNTTMRAFRLVSCQGKYAEVIKILEGGAELSRTEIGDITGLRGRFINNFVDDLTMDYSGLEVVQVPTKTKPRVVVRFRKSFLHPNQ